MRTELALLFCACLLLARIPAAGQAAPAVEFSIEEGGVFTPLTNAATFQAPAVGQPVTARMRIRNTSAAEIRVDQISVQDARFSLTGADVLPAVLPSNQSITFAVTYLPTSSTQSGAQIVVRYAEILNPGLVRTASQALAGTVSGFRLAYLTPEGNVLPVPVGGTLTFPETQVNGNSTITMIIANTGATPGQINSLTLTGAAFRPQGLPLFPVALEPGQEFRFNVRFTPLQVGRSTGTLVVDLPAGELSASVDGAGSLSLFRYELLLPDSTQPFTPGSPVLLPETELGTTMSVGVRVMNTGNRDELINTISVIGGSLQLSELPPLPALIPSQDSIVFVLTFTPRDTGPVTGRLRIGNEVFEVITTGAGSRLLLSYRLGEAIVTVPPSGNVIFAPTPVGNTSTIDLLIENKGNRVAHVANVSAIQTGTSFSLTGLPALPIQLQPNQSLALALRFSPPALGEFTGSLRINSETVNITGSATQPAPIPSYSFTGPSGNVEQMQQPAVGLRLDEPYPLPLRGTLTIGFESETFVVDPAIQFATGGGTVSFTIEAGSTEAVFSTGATSIRLQTGTVAGTIILTPSFSTAALNITPPAPATLRLAILPSAPRLTNLQIGALSSSSVTFLLNGASTPRSLQAIEIVFNLHPATSIAVRNTTLTIDIEALAEAYYRSAASAPFGSIIQASAPVSITNPVEGTPSLFEIFDSATVTLINTAGRSNSMTIALR